VFIRGKISWFFREISAICGQNFFVFSCLGGELFWTKRAAIYNQIPKKIKNFYNFLTLCPTTTYLFSASSAFSAVNVFFVPNAQLRPIVERRCFSAP